MPRGVRVYAVGDVHGRLDLLLAMEALIEADRREHGRFQDVLIVHLGDLVDRGFESRKVLDHLLATGGDGPTAGHAAGQPRSVAARVRGRRA